MTPSSQIIRELAQKPRAEVEADLSRVTAERERLATEETFLKMVLEIIGVGEDAASDASRSEAGTSEGVKGTAREHILAVMQPPAGFEPWPIQRVVEGVQQRNPAAQPPAIRLALRRLEKEGILLRDQHKNYRLFPQQTDMGDMMIIPFRPIAKGQAP